MNTYKRTETHPIDTSVHMTLDRYSGEGPPILLLHGIPGTRRTWGAVADRLCPTHAVIVPDLLGFGGSSEPPDDRHAPGQAVAMLELLNRLGIADIHLVGFDFGGPVALTMYRAQPARFGSLTLVATNAFTDTPVPLGLKVARVPVAGEAVFSFMCSRAGLAMLWLPGVGDKRALPWHAFRASLPDARGRMWTRRIFLDSLRHLHSRYEPIEATLARVTCPTAVVWGDRDPFFPVNVGERTGQAITGSTFHLLRGCGHFIPQERPEALAAVILATAGEARTGRRAHVAG